MVMFSVGDAAINSALELEFTGRPIAWLQAPSELRVFKTLCQSTSSHRLI